MLPAFEPDRVERGVAAWWRDGAGRGKPSSGKVFSMVIPPPNVTGQLHIGHALTVTVQDALVRYHEMRGDKVVWVPGMDHAGIATQAVVERRLAKAEGLTRHDLGRDAFLERVWEWVGEHKGKIGTQLSRLGARLDWDREVFTMDEIRSRAVTETFVELHRRGLIYRDVRLVNWCPHLRTVISDLEVEHEELGGALMVRLPGQQAAVELGVMHDFAYPVKGGGELVVSTTRLETMLGDTAVAIHPDDPRYASLHGKAVVHPFFPDREIPIVLDAQLVDMELGTGAVKVTPAHDENDFACGQRHGLPSITILDDDGKLNAACGPEMAGMDRFAARSELVRRLEQLGLYRGKRANPMRIARCSRSGDLIEPMLKPQWFVRCDAMAQKALDLARNGKLDIQPAWHAKTWEHFLSNIRDWCVSRQLWWGHRIPAFRVVAVPGSSENGLGDASEERWVVAATREEAERLAAAEHGLTPGSFVLKQDEDVLDTWFSSALFPLSALGWPDALAFDKSAYPLSLMETGADILFFWVARMVMLCSEMHEGGEPPFQKVFLHPIIRDRQGRKMSKSLGNVIDPLNVIDGTTLEALLEGLRSGNLDTKEVGRASDNLRAEFPDGIPACGADALRLALASYMHSGEAINLDLSRVVTWRHFGNKLWNAVRFVLMQEPPPSAGTSSSGSLADVALPLETRWICSRLAGCVEACETAHGEADLARVTQAVFDFVVSDFCDVYLEASKRLLRDQAEREATLRVLVDCVDATLRLLHPLAPFITEELWHRCLASHVVQRSAPIISGCSRRETCSGADSIASQPFPSVAVWGQARDVEAERDMGLVMACVSASRGLREKLVGVLHAKTLSQRVQLVSTSADAADAVNLLRANEGVMLALSRFAAVEFVHDDGGAEVGPALEQALRPGLVVRLPLRFEHGEREKVAKEIKRLANQLGKAHKQEERLRATLDSERYQSKAPPHVIAKDRERLVELQATSNALQTSMGTLKALVGGA